MPWAHQEHAGTGLPTATSWACPYPAPEPGFFLAPQAVPWRCQLAAATRPRLPGLHFPKKNRRISQIPAAGRGCWSPTKGCLARRGGKSVSITFSGAAELRYFLWLQPPVRLTPAPRLTLRLGGTAAPGGHPHQCQGVPTLVALGCAHTGTTTLLPQEEGCKGCWWDLEGFWV